jgi:molecular chaperone DnaK
MVLRVTLALGIQTAGKGQVRCRNTALPAAARALFTTVSDYQRRADITVLQGERLQAADDIRLGSFQLEDLKPTGATGTSRSASKSTWRALFT